MDLKWVAVVSCNCIIHYVNLCHDIPSIELNWIGVVSVVTVSFIISLYVMTYRHDRALSLSVVVAVVDGWLTWCRTVSISGAARTSTARELTVWHTDRATYTYNARVESERLTLSLHVEVITAAALKHYGTGVDV